MAVNKFDNSMLDADAIGTSANQLVQLDSNTKYPAVDGSLLTGIPSPFTASASDPTISTNPSGGVGTLWTNTSSGEVYCCTDATAGANVWTNVGIGSVDIPSSWTMPGTQYGYVSGGTGTGGHKNIIDRFTFTSISNATDVGDLSANRGYLCGQSSSTHGYSAGSNNVVDKFSFLSGGNATDALDMTESKMAAAGVSSASYGFVAGGNTSSNVINKYPFASDTNATDIADLIQGRMYLRGCSSSTHGYGMGGYPGSDTDTIDKWSTASDANATDVGNLNIAKDGACGVSSETHGYACGGQAGGGSPAYRNEIEKVSFSSDGNTTDVGDMTGARNMQTGSSSKSHGYVSGGENTSTGTEVRFNTIEQFSFSTDGNSTDHADITFERYWSAGQSY